MRDYGVGPIDVEGCVTSAMVLRGDLPPEAVPDVIERDRLHMAARPGLYIKLLPVLRDPANGNVLTGGAYLFDRYAQAEAFDHWTANEFVVDGVPFVQMPALLSRTSKVWRVAGAENFAAVAGQQVVMRVEEWRVPAGVHLRDLRHDWPELRAQARTRGLSAAWLLGSEARGEIGLVSAGPRVDGPATAGPDLASLEALADTPSLGTRYEAGGARKLYERTSFVFTVWFPLTGAGADRAPLWPNSPPLPAPSTPERAVQRR
ncbi:MAG: hypothetical protein IT495_20525 [Gammaproteobacteria bacterium]|nr:hypothetical protein [Gammaproteobacteria bacterium]